MKKFYSTSLLLSFLFFICASVGNSQPPSSQTFTVSGTYTINVGFSAVITIEAWGGGAGGGSGAAERGGGGGGAYASTTTTLSAGSFTVTVGTGGAVGANGTNSSFNALVIAAGGTSTTTSTGGAGGTVAASTGLIRFAGGAGGNAGNTNSSGGGGGGSATASANGGIGGNGANGNGQPGGTGGTGEGPGGAGAANTASAAAVAGTVPGGGGGGRASNATTTSAAGANGRVVITVSSVLPVRLKTFQAIKKATSVELQWNSESEANLADYVIEKSTDGVNFSALSSIAARNSSNSEIYNYTDAAGNSNAIYYRIAITELDGKVTFSRIVKVVSNGKGGQLQVYPNPVKGGVVNFITPELAKGVYSVEVFNSTAQVVYKMRYTHSGGALSQSIQLTESLKPGIYSIHIKEGQVKYQHNFLIQ